MSAAPILVLQMQRMGDLVLSFPLLTRLMAAHPGHPLWIIGEEQFFKPLLPLSPPATYFSSTSPPSLSDRFLAVINLSLRPEAAYLAGQARTDRLVGPWLDKDGNLFIEGDWQLYRASLTHNNRYNLFHWSDLNALDAVPPPWTLRDDWTRPRPIAPAPPNASPGASPGAPVTEGRVGLFIGASEPEKRPDPPFWAGLARMLIKAGHKPVFLGGEAEKTLGQEASGLLDAPSLNLCGCFDVASLARFIGELDLLVTPDTGPMHIASALGTPVLNLSMGPVNPWETGPSAPGHHVLRPALPCAGCWSCTEGGPLCRDLFTPAKTAAVIFALLAPGLTSPEALRRRSRDLELLQTGRDKDGLYELHSRTGAVQGALQGGDQEAMARPLLSRFWQGWFGSRFGLYPEGAWQETWKTVRNDYPEIADGLKREASELALNLARTWRANPADLVDPKPGWKPAGHLLGLLTGFLHMHLQNRMGDKKAVIRALRMAEELAEQA